MLGLGFALPRMAAGLRLLAGTAPAPSPAPTPAPTPTPVPAPTPTPTPGPAYLPALSTPGAHYHAVYSNERLLASYAGPMLYADGERGAGPTGLSPAEVQAARGGAEGLRLVGWYDQSGNGRGIINTNPDEMPAVREDVRIGPALAMIFDGIRAGDSRGSRPRRVTVDLGLNAGDCTFAFVIDPTVSVQQQYYFEMRNAADSATAIGLSHYPGSQFGGVLPDIHGNLRVNGASCGRKIATVPQAMVIRSTAAGMDVFIDGAKVATLAANTAGTAGTLTIGALKSTSGLEDFIPTFRMGAFAAIDKGVNDTDVAAISAAMMQRFAIPSAYDAVVVNIGTSRVAGMSRSTLTRTKAWFERANYGSRRIRTYNLGFDGKSISGSYADRNVFDAEIYAMDPGLPHVFVIDDPINDLGGLGASTDPAAIYATYTNYRNALKALGANVNVVFATGLPQASGAYGGFGRSDAAIDADRITLNTAMRNNAGAADAISDPASSAEMGAYPASPNDLAKYSDRLHPTSTGYAFLAGFNPAATNGFLQ